MLTSWLKQNPIPSFFILTFLIAWSIWLPLGIFAPENYLLSLPGVWAPTVSAFILTWLNDGKAGVQSFIEKILRWRVGFHWYLVVLLGIAAIAYLAIGLGNAVGLEAPELSLPYGLPRQSLIGFLPVFFLANLFIGGPLAEDIGWRGYIFSRLREKMNAVQASLLIGIVWAIWHLPYFIFPAWNHAVGNIPFIWFALLTTSWSVLFAWVYVNTESILMPVLFHASINTTLGTLGILGQADGDLVQLVLNTILTWLIVGMIIEFYGSDLKREADVSNSVTSRSAQL